MITRLNIFAANNISMILMSVIFLCLSCSILNNDVDDKSETTEESENNPNSNLVVEDNVENNSPKNSTVKGILSESASEYTIASVLCDNTDGPNCTKLRLGDDFLTTSTPAKGYLYSCIGKNSSALGSIESKIT